MSKTNVSNGYRALEIIVGIIAIIAAILMWVYPVVTGVAVSFILGLVLLIMGIFQAGTAAFSSIPSSARYTNAAIGIIAIIIGAIIMIFPVYAIAAILAIALLIWGLGRLVVGGAGRQFGGGLRALLIVLGIIVVIFAILVIIFPIIAILSVTILLSIAFLFIGIDSLASGIVGVPLA